jgi:hypothetical protein
MNELVNEYSLNVIQSYMNHIQQCASDSVRQMLRSFSVAQGMNEVGTVEAEDSLDDGTPLKLAITIDRVQGSAMYVISIVSVVCSLRTHYYISMMQIRFHWNWTRGLWKSERSSCCVSQCHHLLPQMFIARE